MYIINFIRGFFMALADSVPGVSGGTMAFIMGFYDDFINSLNALISKNSNKEKKSAILFLSKLGIGWVVGMCLSVILLSSIFDKEIYKISSLFTGFIIFSIPLIIKEEKNNLINKYQNILFSLLGILVVLTITHFNPASSSSSSNLSFDNPSFILGFYIFLAGIIAISAMVLPGISGSTLLLIFGLYAPIILAIKETITLNFKYVPMLIIFGLGIVIGVISVVRLLKYLLLKYRSQMIYLILGLMIGSIYAVFMGPTTLETRQDPMNFENFSLFFFLIGGLFIFTLDELKVILNKKK